jgi:SAM-dependent methyltransferase
MSILAEILAPKLKRMDRLMLVDESPTMLAYSAQFAKLGAQLVLADVSKGIPMDAEAVDVAVASLGDPYNLDGFWSEVRRIVRPGGRILYTTPSHEWAGAFRKTDRCRLQGAQFALVNGETVCVPSYIYPRDQQKKLIARHGLVVERVANVSSSELAETRLSSKLLVLGKPNASIVTGYLVSRPR